MVSLSDLNRAVAKQPKNEKNEMDFPEKGCLSHFLLYPKLQLTRYNKDGMSITAPSVIIDQEEQMLTSLWRNHRSVGILLQKESKCCSLISLFYCTSLQKNMVYKLYETLVRMNAPPFTDVKKARVPAMTAVIYARYSTDSQRKNPLKARSVNAQPMRKKRLHGGEALYRPCCFCKTDKSPAVSANDQRQRARDLLMSSLSGSWTGLHETATTAPGTRPS